MQGKVKQEGWEVLNEVEFLFLKGVVRASWERFKQGSEGVSLHWGKSIPGRGSNKDKSPEIGAHLVCCRNFRGDH